MKPTLGQVFAASLLGLGAILAVLFYVVFDASRQTIVESSERMRDGASREIGERVTSSLAQAPAAVELFQRTLHRDLVDPRDQAAVERALLAPLLANNEIGELTLTYGEMAGFAPNGAIQLAPEPRGQSSVWRTMEPKAEDRFFDQQVRRIGGMYVADRRELGTADRAVPAGPPEAEAQVPDPTLHPTFTTPASRRFYGQALWSDLHWSQVDANLPEAQRRVEVSVQQVVTDSAGRFAGVLRVGLLKQQLDRAVELKLGAPGEEDAHLIFLCDGDGRLITRGLHPDRLREDEGDLRVAPENIPEPIARALHDPALRAVDAKSPSAEGHFQDRGEEYLTTFRLLPNTQGWIVGIAVPRAFYLGKLTVMRERLLLLSLGIMSLLVAGGVLLLRGVKRAQAQIVRQSLRMDAFDFAPSPTAAPFRDVSEVLESLEKAKTAMRAMGKYVPIDLVRRLYRDKREPALGGEEIEVSIMFTDIKDFTPLSERLPPDRLAAALGRYLEIMAGVIQQETSGTIDKYIGDAIMAIWNAPEPVPHHARMACRAALRCRRAGLELARAPEWAGLPPFETRFGLHCETALVGHFGAPDRMNYTAIGDAVNLASRLEGLNKVYGTAIIASEAIVGATGAEFDFRLLDVAAVKGKSQAVRIYELLGQKGQAAACGACVADYEKAFAAYLAREFAAALALLETHPEDPPSVALQERCRLCLEEPPPPGWDGTRIVTAK